MFEKLPNDVLVLISSFMNSNTFCNFRRVYRVRWYPKLIKNHSLFILSKKENEFCEFPNYGNVLNFQKQCRLLCVHCKHKSINFIEWTSGDRRPYIPWCPMHVYPPIMDCVECYFL